MADIEFVDIAKFIGPIDRPCNRALAEFEIMTLRELLLMTSAPTLVDYSRSGRTFITPDYWANTPMELEAKDGYSKR